MSNWGIAHLIYNSTDKSLEVLGTYLIQPTVEPLKRKSYEDLNRAKQLYEAIQEHVEWADIVVAEFPTGSQSSRAMVNYAMCISILSTISKPLIAVTPQEVKKVVNKDASKAEIIDWVCQNHPEVKFPTYRGKITKSKAEHMADAIVASHAALLFNRL